jgi:hypothetical protein
MFFRGRRAEPVAIHDIASEVACLLRGSQTESLGRLARCGTGAPSRVPALLGCASTSITLAHLGGDIGTDRMTDRRSTSATFGNVPPTGPITVEMSGQER